MITMSSSRIAAGIAGVAIIGLATVFMSGVFNPRFTDGGVDVRNTRCENIVSARQAIAAELEARRLAAQETNVEERDNISDAYWTQNQSLEARYHECISQALTADPCKELFEEGDRLYGEIMADFAADRGFNEAKFNEREAVKKKYNDCVAQAQKPEFYQDQEIVCETELATGREANQSDRVTKEAGAKIRYDELLARAQDAYQQKSAILDEIEKKCKEPGVKKNFQVGSITTGGAGTTIQSNSSACTGVFSGNDSDLRRRIADLENQLQKAKAAGLGDGLFGSEHLQEALDELKQELKDSVRTCETDADCGNTETVCCSDKQVGRVSCADGICVAEKKDCLDPEICAGSPAQCVAPSTGIKQQDGVYISRTIPEVGACSENLQVLNLQQATPDSNRYSIAGNIPNWLRIDKPSGALPGAVNVTYSCGTVQGFGPGNYTVNGDITVYNATNELINTIPFNVSITVTAVAKMIDVIEFSGKFIPIDQVHRFTGPECDRDEHWHANSGSAIALDGSSVVDVSDCGYGKTKEVPILSVPDTRSEN